MRASNSSDDTNFPLKREGGVLTTMTSPTLSCDTSAGIPKNNLWEKQSMAKINCSKNNMKKLTFKRIVFILLSSSITQYHIFGLQIYNKNHIFGIFFYAFSTFSENW